MKIIKFHFYKNDNLVSTLISLRLASVFYHSSVEFVDDELLFQSNFSKGVHHIDPTDDKKPFVTIDVSVSDEVYHECISKSFEFVGLKYDVKAIVGFFLSKLKKKLKKLDTLTLKWAGY